MEKRSYTGKTPIGQVSVTMDIKFNDESIKENLEVSQSD